MEQKKDSRTSSQMCCRLKKKSRTSQLISSCYSLKLPAPPWETIPASKSRLQLRFSGILPYQRIRSRKLLHTVPLLEIWNPAVSLEYPTLFPEFRRKSNCLETYSMQPCKPTTNLKPGAPLSRSIPELCCGASKALQSSPGCALRMPQKHAATTPKQVIRKKPLQSSQKQTARNPRNPLHGPRKPFYLRPLPLSLRAIIMRLRRGAKNAFFVPSWRLCEDLFPSTW